MKISWFSKKNILLGLILCMSAIDFGLLSVGGYFSISQYPKILFGIRGVTMESENFSYKVLENECRLPEYCSHVKGFHQSGMMFETFIVIDAFLLALIIAASVLIDSTLRRIVNKSLNLSKNVKSLLKVLTFVKNLLFLHPFIVNSAFILWIIYSGISKFSDRVILHEGLALTVIQSFLSWLSTALYIWILTSIRRRNLRMLRKKPSSLTDQKILP